MTDCGRYVGRSMTKHTGQERTHDPTGCQRDNRSRSQTDTASSDCRLPLSPLIRRTAGAILRWGPGPLVVWNSQLKRIGIWTILRSSPSGAGLGGRAASRTLAALPSA